MSSARTDTLPLVGRVRVLDSAACAAIVDSVYALRSHWTARDAAAFYSLGAALYLDQPRPETLVHFTVPAPPAGQYAALAAATNPVLAGHFAALYDALRTSLGVFLGAEVRYAEGLAWPGFHIFEHAHVYAESSAHVPHFDRQYECRTWPEGIDFSTAISVTLPLRLPAQGGGLRVWALNLAEVQALPHAAARARAAAAPSTTHRYRPGELVCHRGHLLHQIRPWASRPGEARITLQAHGLYYDDAWQLYW